MPDNDQRLAAVRRFASACRYEKGHSEQVTRLAGMLFEGLRPLHGLDRTARFWLTCAGLLHDIGWLKGQKAHHKTSMQMILADTTLPLADEERAIIAVAARYHRKALPKAVHPVYEDLTADQRVIVEKLAAMLRLADGLDRTHTNAVSKIDIEIGNREITLHCSTRGPASEELAYGKAKADLLEKVFACSVRITDKLTKR